MSKQFQVDLPGSLVQDFLTDMFGVTRNFLADNQDIFNALYESDEHFSPDFVLCSFRTMATWQAILETASEHDFASIPAVFQDKPTYSAFTDKYEINRALELSLYWTLVAHITCKWYARFNYCYTRYSRASKDICANMHGSDYSVNVFNSYGWLHNVITANFDGFWYCLGH